MEIVIETQLERHKESKLLLGKIAFAAQGYRPTVEIYNFARAEKARRIKESDALQKLKALYPENVREPIFMSRMRQSADEWPYYHNIHLISQYLELISKKPISTRMSATNTCLGSFAKKNLSSGFHNFGSVDNNCRYIVYLLISNYIRSLEEEGSNGYGFGQFSKILENKNINNNEQSQKRKEKQSLERIKEYCAKLKQTDQRLSFNSRLFPELVSLLVHTQQRLYDELLDRWRNTQNTMNPEMNAALLIGQKPKIIRQTTSQCEPGRCDRGKLFRKKRKHTTTVQTLPNLQQTQTLSGHNRVLLTEPDVHKSKKDGGGLGDFVNVKKIESFKMGLDKIFLQNQMKTKKAKQVLAKKEKSKNRESSQDGKDSTKSLCWRVRSHRQNHSTQLFDSKRTTIAQINYCIKKSEDSRGSICRFLRPLSVIQDFDMDAYMREAEMIRKSKKFGRRLLEEMKKRNHMILREHEVKTKEACRMTNASSDTKFYKTRKIL